MITYIEPPKDLFEKIVKRIHREERILVFKKIIIFSITLIAAIAGFAPTLKFFLSDLSQSGFFNFFSLAFYDFSAVMAYWQSFAMILLETLPTLSLLLFLAVLLTFLQSLKYLIINIKIISGRNHLATA